MARNGSGTMSIVNTFTPSTTISSSAVNANNTDIASEITNSLALDGQSSMTGQFKAASGTAATPGMGFAADTNTGLYRKGSDNVGAVAGGSDIWEWTTSGIVMASGKTLTGNLTGNVTGNLTGNVTGNVTGDVTGTASLNALKTITISAGTGLTGGGTLAADRTISLATSGVSANTYAAPQSLTIDTYGRITSATAGHPITASATCGSLTGTPTLGAGSFNASACSVPLTGTVRLTFSSAMSNTNYRVAYTVNGSGASVVVNTVVKNVAYVELYFLVTSSGAAYTPTSVDITVFGGV